MNRRDFLGTMLAVCAAPAIVRADSLMRIVPVSTEIILPSVMLANNLPAGSYWFSCYIKTAHNPMQRLTHQINHGGGPLLMPYADVQNAYMAQLERCGRTENLLHYSEV